MALYEYKCKDCGEISEILVMSGDTDVECKKCGSPNLEKLFSGFAVSMAPGRSSAPVSSCPAGGCCSGGACGLS